MDLDVSYQPSQGAYNWDLLEILGMCMRTFSKGRTVGPCRGRCQHDTVRTQGTVSCEKVFGRIFFKGLVVEDLDFRISWEGSLLSRSGFFRIQIYLSSTKAKCNT